MVNYVFVIEKESMQVITLLKHILIYDLMIIAIYIGAYIT